MFSYIHKRTKICGPVAENKGGSAGENGKEGDEKGAIQKLKLLCAAQNFRQYGHRIARINPLEVEEETIPGSQVTPELDISLYGLDEAALVNLDGLVYGEVFQGQKEAPVRDVLSFLKEVYTQHISYEWMHIENSEERDWFTKEIEGRVKNQMSSEEKIEIALEMAKSQNLDRFLQKTYPMCKRFGGEGCEPVMAFYLELFRSCVRQKVDHIVVAKAHRGRLNFLSGPLKFPLVGIFQRIEGLSEFPKDARGVTGDIVNHIATSVELDVQEEKLHVTLLPNPSHLEIVNPVAVGKVRAKQMSLPTYKYTDAETDFDMNAEEEAKILCFQIHGDAALCGQGVNQETLEMSRVPHFRVGGSVHLVINNQVGFTTPPNLGRSSRYPTDIAKGVNAPVIHVNGDYPEEVVKATQLAVDYRQKFHKDIFVELVCFRRIGHQELDDPLYTNPTLYQIIRQRPSFPDKYCKKLEDEGIFKAEQVKEAIEQHDKAIKTAMGKIYTTSPPKFYLEKQWAGIGQAGVGDTNDQWETGMDAKALQLVAQKSTEFPQGFELHPYLKDVYFPSRLVSIASGENISWTTAENLAFGTLLLQGFGVRLSGEDVGRGAIHHRHARVVDQNTGEIRVPLNHLKPDQNKFLEVANSILSEEAVLAFEWGFTTENPSGLVLWESQYGDFADTAQVPIDCFVTGGEAKWMLHSGIVMTLPHGLDGGGPEHSSARVERFLQLTDSNECAGTDGDHNNFQVVCPTTASQYFHVLRRQMVRNFRKPLAVIVPKVYMDQTVSKICEFLPGTHFQPVLGDDSVDKDKVTRLVFVTGKHYYALDEKRKELKMDKVAIIRIESLCPFPAKKIKEQIALYSQAKEIIWSQEEHRNQGAWSFIQVRFRNIIGREISYVGREVSGVPTVGINQVLYEDATRILNDTFSRAAK